MKEESYFAEALGKFTYDAACGGAIRHLADAGFSAEEIKEKLTYPTSLDKIINTFTEHFMNQGIITIEDPRSNETSHYDYICEQGAYGKTSFRKVERHTGDTKQIYLKCSFTKGGVLKEDFLNFLTKKQIAYLQSIDWKRGIHYHVLNNQMTEIRDRVPNDIREKFFKEDV